jgi:hypothetical protein
LGCKLHAEQHESGQRKTRCCMPGAATHIACTCCWSEDVCCGVSSSPSWRTASTPHSALICLVLALALHPGHVEDRSSHFETQAVW